MGLKGKLISQTEIKGCKDLFHEMFRHKPHHLSNIIQRLCSFTNFFPQKIEGKKEVVKVVVEDKRGNKLVTLSSSEGHVIEQYNAFKATVHIENEGENNLVLWTVEYEKQKEDVPEPFSYLQLFLNMTIDIDTHHVNQ
ncbi:hypothetical protein RND71_038553 [Anisodus tanguticus]|uniref:Bet v I/Major latex protein domain-containing protein n=1 Tax=Anisodus tanguticus TaxID=243964 RepID=A0AAE1R2V9_9SOLA|nr:hypothetical protein RND71_038553 [Anisodus tanguticus]